MIHYVLHTPDGRIIQSGSCGSRAEIPAVYGAAVLVTDAQVVAPSMVVAGKVIELPPAPSAAHVFDYSSRAWRLDAEKAWASVRATRDRRLVESDWTTLPDVPLTETQRAAWRTYRQALRDVTKQTDPLNIRWPDPPRT